MDEIKSIYLVCSIDTENECQGSTSLTWNTVFGPGWETLRYECGFQSGRVVEFVCFRKDFFGTASWGRIILTVESRMGKRLRSEFDIPPRAGSASLTVGPFISLSEDQFGQTSNLFAKVNVNMSIGVS